MRFLAAALMMLVLLAAAMRSPWPLLCAAGIVVVLLERGRGRWRL
jgi:hypothetical protein